MTITAHKSSKVIAVVWKADFWQLYVCIWKQWRNKVRGQQHEREKELSDHAVVIKELQKVIGNERIAKEQLENQV